MTMTVTQATAVNVLLRHLYGPVWSQPEPSDEEVQEAAELLAEHAYKRLVAGYRPAQLQVDDLVARRTGGRA